MPTRTPDRTRNAKGEAAAVPSGGPGWPSALQYWHLVEELLALGYHDEIAWANAIQPPDSPEDFAAETIFIICNSGMRAQIARAIYERVMAALLDDRAAATAFGHPGKCGAIDRVWRDRETLYAAWRAASDKLAFLRTLPHIGPVTVYHLAKNFGLPVVKPDRWLVRLGEAVGETPQALCERVAAAYNHSVAAVDTVLWRACNLGLIAVSDGRVIPGPALRPNAVPLIFGDPEAAPLAERMDGRAASS